jgi:hypothetical protein
MGFKQMKMKKPAIVDLGIKERQELIDHVENSSLKSDDKKILVEIVSFFKEFEEQLKSSRISISKLKSMILGFKADHLKKLLQIH